jgi:uroporphyrinogen decarboxylase
VKLKARARLIRALNFEEVEAIPLARAYTQRQGQFGGPFLEDDSIPLEKKALLREEINPVAVSGFQYDPDIYRNGWDQWGVFWEKIHDIHHPIKEWDDLLTYSFPKVQPDLFPAHDIAHCRQEGETVIFGGGGQLITFERYRTLRGFENCLTDPILYPENCHDLIGRIERYNRSVIQRWLELGCDIVGLADDLGSMRNILLSPELWRRFYKPCYRRYCELIHEAGAKAWLHSDGAIAAIIPDLVEVGVDILDPVQAECIDIRRLAAEYKGRLVVWGGMNSHVIGLGTYDSVRRHASESIEVFDGFRGGMVGTGTNYLLPSIDVALALYRAFRGAP